MFSLVEQKSGAIRSVKFNSEQQKYKTAISTGPEEKLSFLSKAFKFLFLMFFPCK